MQSDFNKKVITQNLDIIFITRVTFFIRNSFKIYYEISGPHIFCWSMVGWSAFGALGRWSSWSVVGGRLVGWLVGRWSVVGGRFVGGFEKTRIILYTF